MLSADGGESWEVSTVTGSDIGYHTGRTQFDCKYEGGYIGFTSELEGYLVLLTPVSLGSQNARFFLTHDSGKTWEESGNLNEFYPFVITGVGFSSQDVGFVSYRYYHENGPIIWQTKDGCKTWDRLDIELPTQYQAGGYRATPLSPRFSGIEGVYPIEVKLDYDSDPNPTIITIEMLSHDGGLTWSFDEE